MLEATDPEYNLLLGQPRLVQRLLNPRSLKFLPPGLHLLQAFLGGWGNDTGLNGVQHIADGLLAFLQLLLQRRQHGAFLILKLYDRIGNPVDDRIIHYALDCGCHNSLLDPAFS